MKTSFYVRLLALAAMVSAVASITCENAEIGIIITPKDIAGAFTGSAFIKVSLVELTTIVPLGSITGVAAANVFEICVPPGENILVRTYSGSAAVTFQLEVSDELGRILFESTTPGSRINPTFLTGYATAPTASPTAAPQIGITGAPTAIQEPSELVCEFPEDQKIISTFSADLQAVPWSLWVYGPIFQVFFGVGDAELCSLPGVYLFEFPTLNQTTQDDSNFSISANGRTILSVSSTQLNSTDTDFAATTYTNAPTLSPTAAPTNSPSASPSNSPTLSPSLSPSNSPTLSPSVSPTSSPSRSPTAFPTRSPTAAPSESPTKSPTSAPTGPITPAPSSSPTDSPTLSPTSAPVADFTTLSDFDISCGTSEIQVKIIISPDQFTEDECSWELKRLGDEDALLSSLPCRSKTLCASPGDYSLTVRDIDGFTPGFGYSVEVEGRRLAAGSSFNVEESKVFSVGSAEAV